MRILMLVFLALLILPLVNAQQGFCSCGELEKVCDNWFDKASEFCSTKKVEFTDDIQNFGNFLMEEAVKNIKILLLFFALYILAIELIINGAIGLYRVKKETEMLNMIYTKINNIENKMEKYLPEGDDK